MKRFVNVFVAPVTMIDGLRDKPDFWTPIVSMLLLFIAVDALHVALVDNVFYVTDMISAQKGWMSQGQTEVLRQSLERGGPAIVVGGVAGVSFAFVLSVLLSAGYLTLMAKFSGGTVTFRHWLGVVAWINVVHALSLLARAVAIIAAPDGRLGFWEANPLSLSNILGREFETMMVAQIDFTNIWRWALLCLTYRRWVSVSWVLSVSIVLIPVLLLYVIALTFGF